MSDGTADSAQHSEQSEDPSVEFSLGGVQDGFIGCVPIALGVAGYGVVFGVLARQAGLSVAEAAFMSATVLAGAAQLIAIKLWETPIPVVAVIGTTFIVNLRYVLMGAALRPWFRQLSPLKAYGSVFFTADENWALTMGKLKSGSRQGAYLLGSGLAIWSFWIIATVIGAIAGDVIGEPSQYGLDFVLTAVFIAIAVGLWDGKSSLLPWTTAFGVAVLSAQYLPGRWYILLGGVAGSLVGVIRFDG
ncbi:AzlC family ABC transporter permease [Natrinema altunense]|uniref:Branched-chain amino acid ABC transporter permease n=1 Tax=Natrinema altunense TaxID=222984 RepID=A0A482Y0L8_9EURY|nr:AzlC family ABC transporter permease [Natrinema altunense]RZH67864.1 branched-chain amino acid ABC transporter permease [Natrinema altunense]